MFIQFPFSSMRSVRTFSLQPEILASLQKLAKQAGMNISKYISQLIEREEHLISEDELLQRCKEAEENYRNGDYVVLKNAKDIKKFFQMRRAR